MSNVTFHLFDATKMCSAEYCKAWYFKCKQDSGTINNLIQQEEYNDLISEYSSYLTQWDQDYEKDKFDWSEDDWNNFYKTTMKEDYDDGTNKAKNTKVNTSGFCGIGGKEKTVEEVEEDSHWRRGVNGSVGGASAIGSGVAGIVNIAQNAGRIAAEKAAAEAAKAASTAMSKNIAAQMAKQSAEKLLEQSTGKITEGMAKGLVQSTTKTAEAASKAASDAAAEAVKKSAEESAKKAAQKVSAIVGCTMALAAGVLYECTAPNRDASKALEQLKALFEGTEQGNLRTSQAELENLGGECVSQAEAAESAQSEKQDALSDAQSEYENKQKELEEKKELYETAVAVMEEIKSRVENGEPLPPEDEAKFKEAQAQVASLGEEVQALSAEVETLKENMSIANEEFEATKEETNQAVDETQSEFDEKMDDAARIQGETDYTEAMEKSTIVSAGVEMAMQAVNVISGTISAVRAFALPFVGWAFGAMGVAGAAMSTHGVIEQGIIIGKANKEKSVREATNDLIDQTEIDYETNMTLKNMANDDINSFIIEGIDDTSDWTLDTSWYDESAGGEELQITPQVSGGGSVNEVIVDQQDPNKKNLEEV